MKLENVLRLFAPKQILEIQTGIKRIMDTKENIYYDLLTMEEMEEHVQIIYSYENHIRIYTEKGYDL